MRKSSNAIFKYTIILGATMSLSACNGIFENIYDDPIETEMEIKENKFSQVKTVEYTEWAYIDLSARKVTTVQIVEEYEDQILCAEERSALQIAAAILGEDGFRVRLR